MTNIERQLSPASGGLWLLSAATALGLIVSIFNYFWTGNGIHGTEGALLVVVSTLLQLIAAVWLLRGTLHGGLKWLFEALILLDLAGTALAAYLLEAWILLAIAAIGFLMQLVRTRPAMRHGAVS
jgi:quinoprotein glucose dehydrogenase